jgi:hypothetical protein
MDRSDNALKTPRIGRPQPAGPIKVLESPKNHVHVYEDRVVKIFESSRGLARRARRESAALRRLAGITGVPALLAISPDGRRVTMSRLEGTPLSECDSVTEDTLRSLRDLVDRILRRGVARHSLPPRDIIVRPDGSAGLVDFERSSQRHFQSDPVWLIARGIMRFHLLRLTYERAPQILTPSQVRRIRLQARLRDAAQRPLKLKRRVMRFVRRAWTNVG